MVDAVSESIRVPFGVLGVGTLGLGMLVRAVARAANGSEPIRVGCYGPRFAQQLAATCCSLACKTVSAAIKVMVRAAPLAERRFDIPVAPIHAAFRPFNGYAPPVGQAGGGG